MSISIQQFNTLDLDIMLLQQGLYLTARLPLQSRTPLVQQPL